MKRENFLPWQIFAITFAFVLFMLGLSRVCLVSAFYKMFSGVNLCNVSMFALRSCQFDCRIAGILLLPFFCISMFFSNSDFLQRKLCGVLKFFISVAIVLTVALTLLDIGYFREYNDRYNFWLFNFFFDDRAAILATIRKSYNLWLIASVAIMASVALIIFYLKLASQAIVTACRNRLSWTVAFLLFAVFFIEAARGMTLRRPLQQIDVAVTGNAFLNKCVPNSYYALYFAWKDFAQNGSIEAVGRSLSEEMLANALKILNAANGKIDDLISHTSMGGKLSQKPQHIFLVVMESQDNWPLLPENFELNLCPNLSHLGNEGLYFKNFVPTGQGTLSAIAVQMCNYPNLGFLINCAKNGLENCELSVGTLFQRLGYETNFYYAGYLSWQRIDRFAPIHGYQHCYGGDSMGAYAGNEWGVDDGDMFAFITKNFDSSKPSFNLILTTSNHPPYSVDLIAENAPLKHFAKFVDAPNSVKYLGHAWYADKCLGNFVKEIESLTDSAMFVITGDHFSRKHCRSKFSLFDGWTVPLVIYGKAFNGELKKYQPNAGSQVDVVRTIIELISERGFEYKSFGRDLLAEDKLGEGYCTEVTISGEYIATNDENNVEFFSDQTPLNANIRDAIMRNRAWQTLGKWKFFKMQNE
ncbi:MAG: LTA synthase family protein [Puniceicoccales bacterium]|jgi:phosphoglycerol transferase MdoB-like AlkP superfamily enzyme|nr:LTA synthase family protein [Puniceicoccales bacterium]